MNNTSSRTSSKASISLAFSGMIFLGLAGGTNGVILPDLSAFYHVGDAIIGLLFLISSIGYCLSALCCGLLTERLGLRWLLGLGWGSIVVGMLGFVFHLPFALLLVARLLMGLGFGLLDTGFNIFISTQPRSPILLNYLHAFWGTGALVGPLMATGMLALLWGWNSIYVVLLVLSLPLLPGIIKLMREPSPTQLEKIRETPAKGGALGTLLALPIVWLLIAFLLLYVGVEQSAGSWAYSFLLEDRAQGTVVAGWLVSGYWSGLTLGRFLIQRQAERMGLSNSRLMFLCLSGLFVGLLIIWLIPIGAIAAFGFCFLGLSLAPIFPLSVAMIPRLVPTHLSASAIGLLVSSSIIGLALFPWIAGILAQALGVWTLLPFLLALAVALLGFWVVLARSLSISEDLVLQNRASDSSAR